ncbi:MAG: hypothetical protein U0573_00195 [Phycisphaerales bacterium]|nr:hypothetical protein [Planctomycetota bacterium]
MKQLLWLVSCGCLALGVAAFGTGCASNKTCDSSAECSGNCSDCKSDCKDAAACKDSGKCKEGDAKATSAAPINTICPLGGHDVDPTITASYQGKTIGFCCQDCKQEFAGRNDQGKAEILAKAETNSQ